jgi:hypothetical protein
VHGNDNVNFFLTTFEQIPLKIREIPQNLYKNLILMNYNTYNSNLQENEKPIYSMSKRVSLLTETVEQVVISIDDMMKEQSRMSVKIDKIHDKVFEKPEYFSVGEIALKQGKCSKTVLRHIHSGNIPYERNEGEKAYRIPSEEYFQSLSHDGTSSWFQSHTRE